MADVKISQLPDLSPASNTYIPLSNGTTTGKTLTNNLGVPIGFIGMWSGSTIPAGWALCDGTNGTPDLRDRFVVGSGSSYAIGATGGSADAIVVSHNHSATSSVTDPGHGHNLWHYQANVGSAGDAITIQRYNGRSQFQNVLNGTTGISVSTSIASTGSSGTNANLPPYYALAYIQKIS